MLKQLHQDINGGPLRVSCRVWHHGQHILLTVYHLGPLELFSTHPDAQPSQRCGSSATMFRCVNIRTKDFPDITSHCHAVRACWLCITEGWELKVTERLQQWPLSSETLSRWAWDLWTRRSLMKSKNFSSCTNLFTNLIILLDQSWTLLSEKKQSYWMHISKFMHPVYAVNGSVSQ